VLSERALIFGLFPYFILFYLFFFEKKILLAKQQQNNANGYHPLTWIYVSEWFSFFVSRVWKKEEEMMKNFDQRKGNIKNLLTISFELGIVQPVLFISIIFLP